MDKGEFLNASGASTVSASSLNGFSANGAIGNPMGDYDGRGGI